MNDMTQSPLLTIAAELRAGREILAQANHSARHLEESRFEEVLRGYIVNSNRRYAFGGIVNLLTSAAAIMEEQSQLESDDWERAAILINECADSVDFKYARDE